MTGAALSGASKKATSLKDLAGIWAHSKADCEKIMTDQLDDMGLAQKKLVRTRWHLI
jgi:hypothetical protein